ncbi:hypothetical protein Tco_0715734 [Tanacetum coccineum]
MRLIRLTTSGSLLGSCRCTTFLGAKCRQSGRQGSWQRLGPSLTCVPRWNPIVGRKSRRASSSICKKIYKGKKAALKERIGFLMRMGLTIWSASGANIPRTFPRLQGLGSNTSTGVPYTEDEIMAIVRRGTFPVLVGFCRDKARSFHPRLHARTPPMSCLRSLSHSLSTVVADGSAGCGDDEPGDDEDGGEDEEDADS